VRITAASYSRSSRVLAIAAYSTTSPAASVNKKTNCTALAT
jgi:hypothetical protein